MNQQTYHYTIIGAIAAIALSLASYDAYAATIYRCNHPNGEVSYGTSCAQPAPVLHGGASQFQTPAAQQVESERLSRDIATRKRAIRVESETRERFDEMRGN